MGELKVSWGFMSRASNQLVSFDKGARLFGAALENALWMEKQVENPFYYASSPGWNTAFEYVGMAFILITFMVCIIAAQVFLNSYRSSEDEILLCARYVIHSTNYLDAYAEVFFSNIQFDMRHNANQ